MAAENSEPRAQLALGQMYESGRGVSTDPNSAVKWYTKAANNGSLLAQRYLGKYYYDRGDMSNSNAENFGKAFEWFKKAADRGDAISQRSVAALYENDFITACPTDKGQAIEYYKMAAHQGDIPAMSRLISIYEQNHEYDKAIYWLEKAAYDYGCSRAYRDLFFMAEEGQGMPQDKAKAKRYQELWVSSNGSGTDLQIGETPIGY